jgi:hypothetical protein
MKRAASAAAAVLMALVALVGAATAVAAADEFPAGWEGYHTYDEMVADIQAVAVAHPDIVSLSSIGTSYKGRQLWAAKVSDNVADDEAEPEVLFDGLHHAREHMSLEMTLKILHWLAEGYGTDTRITDIVDSREVWIVFSVNPDGAEHDIAGGEYHLWRKNRQPTPGSSKIGTDLNRNYDYHWGCCGGSSGKPASLMYRGRRPFSAPETQRVRDFVQSRVVGGWQQIRTHITFHTSGRLVMWPYGYTTTNVPADMSGNDHAAFVAMGKRMAALNGYRPQQASDLYITSGRFGDWMYGTQRVFTYTFELTHGWYPDDSEIARETARNRSAVLYLIEQADCPWRAAGLAAANCGAFYDDLELGHGWIANAQGTDTASDGTWQRGNPQPTSSHGPKQRGTTFSASRALVTGLKAGSSVGANDVDGGLTSITSPAIALPETPGRLTFRYYLAHSRSASSADAFRAVVMADDGDHVVLTERGAGNDDDAAWAAASIDIGAFGGQTIRLRFEAVDGGRGNLVEAAVDDVRVRRP